MGAYLKKMISIGAVLLLLAAGCGILSACGGSEPEEPAQTTEAVTEEQGDALEEATQAPENDEADGCIDNEEDLLY